MIELEPTWICVECLSTSPDGTCECGSEEFVIDLRDGFYDDLPNYAELGYIEPY